jgi:hypothetical protein
MRKACPSDTCSGGTENRQHDFTQKSLEAIPAEDQAVILRATHAPRRCSYCGCVYKRNERILGYYNSGVADKTWQRADPT